MVRPTPIQSSMDTAVKQPRPPIIFPQQQQWWQRWQQNMARVQMQSSYLENKMLVFML